MDEIEQVLSRIDIVELINSYLPLKKSGRNFKALCPFHSEKTPSFMVSPELQIYKCFGCGAGGNAIKFVSEYEKISFGEALRFLAEKVGVKLSSYRPDKQEKEKERLLAINHLAAEFYHYLLTKLTVGKKGLNYLLGRGISPSSIREFKLGFAPRGWENLLRYLVGKKGYQPQELEKAGLVLPRSKVKGQGFNFYDRFRERIIFPIFDHRGQIVGFSGRILEEKNESAKYINTPETPLYHKSQTLYGLWQAKEAIKKAKAVVLVEGEFDVISSFQVGVRNIVAIKGSALTQDQVKLLKRYTDNFYFCLDTDLAGEEAAKRGIQIAEALGVNLRAIKLTSGKDPDESIRTDPNSWKKAVKQTISIYDFYLETAIKKFGSHSGEAKKQVSEAVLPLFNQIQNQVMKAFYFKKLAEALQVSEEVVLAEAKRQQKITQDKEWLKETSFVKEKKPVSKRELTEEYLLALILHQPEMAGELIKKATLDLLATPAVKKIFNFLKIYLTKTNRFLIGDFVKILPAELKETCQRLYLWEEGVFQNEALLWKEWERAWRELEKIVLRDKLAELKKSLEKEENKKTEEEIVKITKRLKTI